MSNDTQPSADVTDSASLQTTIRVLAGMIPKMSWGWSKEDKEAQRQADEEIKYIRNLGSEGKGFHRGMDKAFQEALGVLDPEPRASIGEVGSYTKMDPSKLQKLLVENPALRRALYLNMKTVLLPQYKEKKGPFAPTAATGGTPNGPSDTKGAPAGDGKGPHPFDAMPDNAQIQFLAQRGVAEQLTKKERAALINGDPADTARQAALTKLEEIVATSEGKPDFRPMSSFMETQAATDKGTPKDAQGAPASTAVSQNRGFYQDPRTHTVGYYDQSNPKLQVGGKYGAERLAELQFDMSPEAQTALAKAFLEPKNLAKVAPGGQIPAVMAQSLLGHSYNVTAPNALNPGTFAVAYGDRLKQQTPPATTGAGTPPAPGTASTSGTASAAPPAPFMAPEDARKLDADVAKSVAARRAAAKKQGLARTAKDLHAEMSDQIAAGMPGFTSQDRRQEAGKVIDNMTSEQIKDYQLGKRVEYSQPARPNPVAKSPLGRSAQQAAVSSQLELEHRTARLRRMGYTPDQAGQVARWYVQQNQTGDPQKIKGAEAAWSFLREAPDPRTAFQDMQKHNEERRKQQAATAAAAQSADAVETPATQTAPGRPATPPVRPGRVPAQRRPETDMTQAPEGAHMTAVDTQSPADGVTPPPLPPPRKYPAPPRLDKVRPAAPRKTPQLGPPGGRPVY